VTALDTIAHLDFRYVPPCEGDGCDGPAHYRVQLQCGCVGLLCLSSLKGYKRRLHQCVQLVMDRAPGAWWFDCLECNTRIDGWPIADITALP
jgi:hypothetical protein